MFDDNLPLKLLFALLASGAWIFWAWYPARNEISADTWSTEKFGVWWMARAFVALPVVAVSFGAAFGLLSTLLGFLIGDDAGTKGSSAGVMTIFLMSAVHAVGRIVQNKMK